jgi:hypothetical protein
MADLPEPWHGSIAPAEEPSIAASLEVPPLPVGSPPADGESGGEWEMLTTKLREWFGDGEPQKLLDRIGGPLKTVAYLLALLLLLRVYRSVVGTIDGIPLVSGLLELVGLIALVRFCLLRLVRRSEREEVLGNDHCFDAVISAYTAFRWARDGWAAPDGVFVDDGWVVAPP